MRGIQITDDSGIALFTTIYPGWYSGRAHHVHMKVHIAGTVTGTTFSDGASGHVAHGGQLFFPQAQNDAMRSVSPYANNTQDYTTNAADHVYQQQQGNMAVVSLVGSPTTGFSATVVLAVDPLATPAPVAAGDGMMGFVEGGPLPEGGPPPGGGGPQEDGASFP